MRAMERGRPLVEIAAVCFGILVLVLLVALMWWPIFRPRPLQQGIMSCQNQLKSIGISLILYSNDYKYFPHVKALNEEHTVKDVSKVYRNVVHLGYIERPWHLRCPSTLSEEQRRANLKRPPLDKPKQWSWKGLPVSTVAPIHDGLDDPSLFDNDELSYGYRKAALSAVRAKSNDVMANEKEQVHSEGFFMLYADGHVEYWRSSETKRMQTLVNDFYCAGPRPKDK